MESSCARITISGLGGETGKTVISVGLCRAWHKKGLKVIPFKKGPDYIDMSWLERAANHPCFNLDLFFMKKEQVLFSFNLHTQKGDIAIIEGNRGLYDGMDEKGSVSTAELAKVLKSPVILIVECIKVTRTVAALVLGCLKLDPHVDIKGIILNRIANPRQELVIRKSIEKYCGLPVIGAIPRLTDIVFPGRHLGLVPPQEHPLAVEAIDSAAQIVEKYIDMEKLWQIAKDVRPLQVYIKHSLWQSLVNSHWSWIKPNDKYPIINDQKNDQCPMTNDQSLRIGVIKDSAFQFYYPENLEVLEKAGAKLIEFSALTDDLPSELDALYIGGGFPETHAATLSDNKRLRQSIKRAVEEGLPVYAECGGLMYLCKELMCEGKSYPMVGIFPLVIGVSKKPQGHGYTIIKVEKHNPFFKKGKILRGHEFHYSHILNVEEFLRLTKDNDNKPTESSIVPLPKMDKGGKRRFENEKIRQERLSEQENCVYFAFIVKTGHGIIDKKDGLCFKNVLATYTHLHAIGSIEWIKGIINVAKTYKCVR
ncbi:MAG: cobyrinate a,c-diamide synthase [Thermodesulfovibrionales bacterium]